MLEGKTIGDTIFPYIECQMLSGTAHFPCNDFYSPGFYEAYRMVEYLAKQSLAEITEHDILTIHATALREYPSYNPGEYRTESVCMKGAQHTFPPPFEVSRLMGQYCISTRDVLKHDAPTAAAILHQELVGIHPFLNGNGRVARLIMNVPFLHENLPPLFVTADWVEEYHNALRSVQMGANPEAFVNLIRERVEHNQLNKKE